MTAAKHTPGPWAMDDNCPLVIVDKDGSSIGEMSAGDPFIPDDQQLANARLVCAAPDLLEACEAALNLMGDLGVGSDSPTKELVWKAICKARGWSKE
jgi:hypothetical protein